VLEVAPQRIADLAHLAADGVDLGREGVHLGCAEVWCAGVDGSLDGSAAIDWRFVAGRRVWGRPTGSWG
jgi:hypothetical protein